MEGCRISQLFPLILHNIVSPLFLIIWYYFGVFFCYWGQHRAELAHLDDLTLYDARPAVYVLADAILSHIYLVHTYAFSHGDLGSALLLQLTFKYLL